MARYEKRELVRLVIDPQREPSPCPHCDHEAGSDVQNEEADPVLWRASARICQIIRDPVNFQLFYFYLVNNADNANICLVMVLMSSLSLHSCRCRFARGCVMMFLVHQYLISSSTSMVWLSSALRSGVIVHFA